MKINPVGNIGPINGSQRISKLDLYKNSQSVSRSDRAELSDEAISFSKAFASAKAAAGAESPDKASRIEEIKKQVNDGTYRVDSDKIAESILGDLYG